MLLGGCKGPPSMWDTSLTLPLYGGASPSVAPPLSCWLPCASVGFRDIGMPYGDFSLLLGFGGVPHLLGYRGHQHMGCPYAHSCTFL